MPKRIKTKYSEQKKKFKAHLGVMSFVLPTYYHEHFTTFGIRSYSCYLYIGLDWDLLASCFHYCIIWDLDGIGLYFTLCIKKKKKLLKKLLRRFTCLMIIYNIYNSAPCGIGGGCVVIVARNGPYNIYTAPMLTYSSSINNNNTRPHLSLLLFYIPDYVEAFGFFVPYFDRLVNRFPTPFYNNG